MSEWTRRHSLVTKQFGGRFWIASQVGVGTRIRIVLPRPPAAELI